MQCTILGCGASSGVPVILCECEVCRSPSPINKRLRTSAWLTIEGKDILIDSGLDFRQQALRAQIPKLDLVLFTHPHSDHINGIDDLKLFTFNKPNPLECIVHAWTQSELTNRFAYIFRNKKPATSYVPLIQLRQIDPLQESFTAASLNFTPLLVQHGKDQTLAFRYQDFAYITDCNGISDTMCQRLEKLEILVLDCLRITPHNTHFNLEQALAVVKKLQPKTTIFTHMSHEIDAVKHKDYLPKGVYFAYDTMKL
jgi:phosphoribosyl 1,2-cyclic phosphate phosphodiesterase